MHPLGGAPLTFCGKIRKSKCSWDSNNPIPVSAVVEFEQGSPGMEAADAALKLSPPPLIISARVPYLSSRTQFCSLSALCVGRCGGKLCPG